MTTVKLDTIKEKKPGEASDNSGNEQALRDAEAESAKHRTKLHEWVSWFIPVAVKWWLIILLILLVADSINLNVTWKWHESLWIESFDFDINTYVMVALVGSTSLAVGGLVNYALKSLLGKTQE